MFFTKEKDIFLEIFQFLLNMIQLAILSNILDQNLFQHISQV